ncbi:hypothetical protein EV361DRAFT_114076 [Lentinula raphanica]|nr:hypothetical protein EV361DRAFT_114076 [Lentinula raphanica]
MKVFLSSGDICLLYLSLINFARSVCQHITNFIIHKMHCIIGFISKSNKLDALCARDECWFHDVNMSRNECCTVTYVKIMLCMYNYMCSRRVWMYVLVILIVQLERTTVG